MTSLTFRNCPVPVKCQTEIIIYKNFNLQFQGNSFAPRFLDINGFNLHYETANGIKTQKIKTYKKVSYGHNWDKK